MRATPVEREPLPRLLPVLGWLTAALFFFYAWVLRVAPSVMVEELMRDFAVGAAVLGNLSAAYFYGYAGMQIPIGMLLDRFGPRRLMTIATLVCAAGCVLFATGDTLAAVTAGRFLIGASAAFSLVGAMAVAGQWFRRRPLRHAVGAGDGDGHGGRRVRAGAAARWPSRHRTGARPRCCWPPAAWRWRVAAWATVRDRWRGSGGSATCCRASAWSRAIRQTWLIALAGLGTSAPLLGFAGLWGVPFLETAYGLPRTHAATLTSMLFVGWGVGAPLFGWLSDRIGRRKRAAARRADSGDRWHSRRSSTFRACPCRRSAALCFLVGFFGSSQIVCFALVKENHPAALSGTAIGFVNGMVTGAGALFQPLVGLLLDLAWTGETAHGARVYDTGAYRLALASLIACGLAGVLCLLAVRETYCRPQA